MEPECSLTARSALNAAMGGQRLLWQADRCDSVAQAVSGCAYSVAFDRWTDGGPPGAVIEQQASAMQPVRHARIQMLCAQVMRSKTCLSPQQGWCSTWAQLGC